MSDTGMVRNWPERARSAPTTADTSVSGATPLPSYGIGTTAIGRAEALPPTISISRPRSCASAASGSRKAKIAAKAAKRRGDAFMGRPGREKMNGGRVHVNGVSKRSEEHTSELRSLMRNSYAVFCLKTTKRNKHEIV